MANFLDNAVNTSTETLCDWANKYNALLSELQATLGGGGEFLLKAGDTVPEDFFIRRTEFNPGEWIEMRMSNAGGANIFLGRNGDDDVQNGLVIQGDNEKIFAIGNAKIGHYWPWHFGKGWHIVEDSEFVSKRNLFYTSTPSDVNSLIDLSPYKGSKEISITLDGMTGDTTVFDSRVHEGCRLVVAAFQNDNLAGYNLTLQRYAGTSIRYINHTSLSVSRPNIDELLVSVPYSTESEAIIMVGEIIGGAMCVEIKQYQ